MNTSYYFNAIGSIEKNNDTFIIRFKPEYKDALRYLDEFSHIQVIWWAHLCDDWESRSTLISGKIFKHGPADLGIFATRSPARPNPVMVSTIKVLEINLKEGTLTTPFIDAEPGTPAIDIKPLYPMERVKNCKGPEWSKHWPEWQEEIPEFNWSKEINFTKT